MSTQPVTIRISTIDYEAISDVAEENDRTVSAEVRRAIRQYLERLAQEERQHD